MMISIFRLLAERRHGLTLCITEVYRLPTVILILAAALGR